MVVSRGKSITGRQYLPATLPPILQPVSAHYIEQRGPQYSARNHGRRHSCWNERVELSDKEEEVYALALTQDKR